MIETEQEKSSNKTPLLRSMIFKNYPKFLKKKPWFATKHLSACALLAQIVVENISLQKNFLMLEQSLKKHRLGLLIMVS